MVAGQRDPLVLADLARGSMRTKLPALAQALTGRFDEHHAYLLARMLARIDAIEADIAALDARIEVKIAPLLRRLSDWMRSPASGPAPRR